MTIVATISALLFLGTPAAAADTLTPAQSSEIIARGRATSAAAQARVLGACGTPTETVSYPMALMGSEVTYTSTFSVTSWTGGCAKGKRDGAGALIHRATFTGDNSVEVAEEGTFVNGLQAGLWCTTSYVQSSKGQVVKVDRRGCAVVAGNNNVDAQKYRKRGDGQWELLDVFGNAVEPPSVLAAGTLEAESARLITDARAGKTGLTVQLATQTDALDGLVRGAKLTLSPSSTPLGLNQKRVAIVFSSRTLSEFDRLTAERVGMLESVKAVRSSPSDDANRKYFEENVDPAVFLKGLVTGLSPYVKSIVPADDLAVLKSGEADYALVIHWSYDGPVLTLSEKDFDKFPVCPSARDAACPALLTQTLTAFLIDRDMRAVRQYTVTPERAVKWLKKTDESKTDKLWEAGAAFYVAFVQGPGFLARMVMLSNP